MPTALDKHSFPVDQQAFIDRYLLTDEAIVDEADKLFGGGVLDEFLADPKQHDAIEVHLATRGFRQLGVWNVLEHPLLPGYVVKLPKRREHHDNINRIWTAERLNEVIKTFELSQLVIPQKFLYHIPGRSHRLSSQNYLVFAKKIDILHGEENAFAAKQLSPQTVQQVITFITHARYKDVRGNICVGADKKTVAIIDTESTAGWSDTVEEGLAYFTCLVKPVVLGDKGINTKPMVVVVPSYNNAAFCEKNLISLLSQQYSNFRVIYIDDASTDGCGNEAQQMASDLGFLEKFTLVRNKKNQGAAYNIYHAGHSCSDDEIIVELDGDDWFAHNRVLATINEAYQNGEVWLTYGNYADYPSGNIGMGAPFSKETIQKNRFRLSNEAHAWCPVRTYYAWLFKKINKNDLYWNGKFMPMSHDEARMYAMIEMAGERHKYIDEVLYQYNRENAISDDKKDGALQDLIDAHIFSQQPYERLSGANAKDVGTIA